MRGLFFSLLNEVVSYGYIIMLRLRDLFIPRAENDYQPHSLRRAAMIGMLTLVLITFAVANLQSIVWVTSDWMVSTILPAVIVTETNKERAASALAPLSRSAVLDRAATLKAEHMAANEYFSHFSPDGVSPWYWFKQADYTFVHAGENLAVYFTDSREIVDAWMDSPKHRANILDGNYREIGIGVAQGEFEGYDTVYVVQLFGTPAAPAPVTARTAAVATETNEPLAEVRTEPRVAGAADNLPVRVETKEDTVVMYAEHMATTTGGVPATVARNDDRAGVTPHSLLALATQPGVVLQFVYTMVGGFVFVALLLSILIDLRRQQPLQIAYGGGLLVMMLVLLHIHMAVSSGVLIA